MNKTVTVNLGGIVYHIDEDAYERLSDYLNNIKRHFSASEGRDEIMADIEARIGEMFSEKLLNIKKVIISADVDEVINIMGKPEDFAGDSSSEFEEETSNEQTTKKKVRRIFRDPDNSIIGGVCSGIGAHFNFDPVILRVVFALSLLFFGTGLIVYIVLWIVIPEAKTASEKLEMHGEQVNFENIGKKINEEMESLKKRVDDISGGKGKARINRGARKLSEFLVALFGRFYELIRVIVGLALILFGILLLTIFLSTILGDVNIVYTHIQHMGIAYSLNELILATAGSTLDLTYLRVSLLLLFGIPILSMIIGGIRVLLGLNKGNRILGFSFLFIWLCGLAMLAYSSYDVSTSFDHQANNKSSHVLSMDTSTTIILACNETSIESKVHNASSAVRIGDWVFLGNDGSYLGYNEPVFDVEQSPDSTFHLVLYKESLGESIKDAERYTQEMDYNYELDGSKLIFDNYFSSGLENGWKNQELSAKLYIPVGAKVYLDESMKNIIYDIDNVTNTSDRKMLGHTWRMTIAGLACIDCNE